MAKFNLNQASKEDLVRNVPGLSESHAETIINYRENKGRIENFDELSNIQGLDNEMVQKIRENAEI